MRVVFMGTPDFAVPALKALLSEHEVVLVVTKPDRPAGRKKKIIAPPIKVVAEGAGIEVLQPESARTPEFLDAIVQAKADIGVVVAYGKILPLAVLQAFPMGCVNIHGSLLPKHRGAAPIQRSLMSGDSETGVSIMLLDEGMDTGPVLLQKKIPILESDTAGTLFENLAPLGADALLEALTGLSEGTLLAIAQEESQATYAAMLKKQDGLVDWSQPAKALAARIRGLDPWPGAFTPFVGGNLKLFGATHVELTGDFDSKDSGCQDSKSHPTNISLSNSAPGAVLSYDKAGIVIACGDGALCVSEVQAPGKKRISAHSFANGRRLNIGETLNPGGGDE